MTVNYNMRQLLLQSATAILLQNPREVYCKMCQVFYYKTRQFHYKMLQSLQNATTLLQNIDFHYKLRQYNIYPLHQLKQEIHDMVDNRAS